MSEPEPILEHRVPAEFEPRLRLDRYCAQEFVQLPSKAAARKAIKRGEVHLNGGPVESARFVRPGDLIALMPSTRRPPALFECQVDVLYEDASIAVVDKPPGVWSNGARQRTLENALPLNLERSREPDALRRPRVTHRLDAQTQGLVICAKTAGAHVVLGRAFEHREIHKTYLALVVGKLEGEGLVELPIEGRAARTRWRVLAHNRSLFCTYLSVVELSPLTGRTHQLRRHMAHLGHPILGDGIYGDSSALRGKGLFLCALALDFTHPISGEPLHIERSWPTKFRTFLERETRRWSRYEELHMDRLMGLRALLSAHEPQDALEAEHLGKMRALARAEHGDPCARDHYLPGHFTASSFVLSPERDALLLILHGKLHRWLQPGGHIDPDDADVLSAARREVEEEVGIAEMTWLGEGLFDVDVHVIPARKGAPAHEHHDLRFLFQAPSLQASAGSDAKDARWVPLSEIHTVESDASVMRAVSKIQGRTG